MDARISDTISLPQRRLTDVAIRALAPRGKQYEVRDSEVRGLALRVNRTSKTWVLIGRFGRRHSTRHKLGEYPDMSLADARAEARHIAIHEGKDPAAVAAAARQTFGDVCEDYFIDCQRRCLRRAREVERDMRRDLVRWWHRPIDRIERADVLHLVRNVVDGRSTWAAHHAFSYVSRVFAWAVEQGHLTHSPVSGLRPSRLIGEKQPRERVLTDDELRALWIGAGQLGYPGGPFIKMFILTGQRRGEVAGMRWSEIQDGLWVIPAARMKMKTAHAVPLVAVVLGLLDALPRFGDHVFTTDGKRSIAGFHYIRKRLPGDGWTLHDIRRTMRTGLSALRVPSEVAERVIGHAPRGLVRVYDRHDYLDEKRETLQRWADKVARLKSGN